MRLFIAVNFDAPTKDKLACLREELRKNSRHGSFTQTDNLHLTLAFLGECSTKQLESASAAMDAVSFKPFVLTVDQIGCFRRSDGDIWWAGIAENRVLLDIQSSLANRLVALEFNVDKRRYNPHITVGRRVDTNAVARRIKPFSQTISSIELMKSQHVGGKLIYTPVHSKYTV